MTTNDKMMFLSGAGLLASTLSSWGYATLLIIGTSAVYLLYSTYHHLKSKGKGWAALTWSALPAIESAIVMQFSDQTDLLITLIAGIFALWAVVGYSIILRNKPNDSLQEDQEEQERTIQWGSEIPTIK